MSRAKSSREKPKVNIGALARLQNRWQLLEPADGSNHNFCMLRRCLRVVESEAYNIQLGLVCVERFERIGAVKTPQRLIRRNQRTHSAHLRSDSSAAFYLCARPAASSGRAIQGFFSFSTPARASSSVRQSTRKWSTQKCCRFDPAARAIIRRPAQQTNAKPMPSTTLCDFSSKRIRNESAFVLCRGTSSEFGVRARTICIQQPGEHIAPEVGANG